MSIFQKSEWEPYVGPREGFGWRNIETDEIAYQEEPPGDVNTENFSDEELDQLSQLIEEAGGDPSLLEDDESDSDVSVPDVEELDVGDSVFWEPDYGSPERWEVSGTSTLVGEPKVKLTNEWDESKMVGQDDIDEHALPMGDMPEYSNVPEWAKEGTPMEVVRERPDGSQDTLSANVTSLEGNIVELRGSTYVPDMLMFMDDEILAPFDTANEATTYHSPEHGELSYTGEDDGYREYVFENEEGDEIVVNTDEEDLYEKPVEDVSLKSEPEFTNIESSFGEERGRVIRDTVSGLIEANNTALNEVRAESNLQIGGRDTVASYNFSTGDMGLSVDSMDPEDLEKYAVKMEEDGWLVEGSTEHVCAHEVMHSIHHHAMDGDFQKEFDSVGDEELTKQVSEYAAYNPAEFVAEYGALLARGVNLEEYVDDVDELDELFEKYAKMSPDEVNAI